MKKKWVALLLCMVMLGTAVPSYGTEDIDAKKFTLEQAIAYALENSPQIGISETNIEKAKVNLDEATDAARRANRSKAVSFDLLLMKDGYLKRAAEMGLLVAEKTKIKTEETIKFSIENSYFNLLVAQDNLKVGNSILAIAKENLDIINMKYSQGLISQMDVIISELAYSQLVTKQKSAERLLEYARMSFNKSMGLLLNAKTELTDKLEMNPPSNVDIEEKVTEALVNRLEVIAADEKFQVDKLNFEITGNWYTPNTYKYQQAKYTMDSSEYAFEDTKKNIELEVHKLYIDMINTYEMLGMLNQSIEHAKKAYEIAEIQYEAQMITVTEKIEFLNRLHSTELDKQQALLKYNLAQKQFELSYGIGL